MTQPKANQAPSPWEPPIVKRVGSIADVLKGGGGKLSTADHDPGDRMKPKGQG